MYISVENNVYGLKEIDTNKESIDLSKNLYFKFTIGNSSMNLRYIFIK